MHFIVCVYTRLRKTSLRHTIRRCIHVSLKLKNRGFVMNYNKIMSAISRVKPMLIIGRFLEKEPYFIVAFDWLSEKLVILVNLRNHKHYKTYNNTVTQYMYIILNIVLHFTFYNIINNVKKKPQQNITQHLTQYILFL